MPQLPSRRFAIGISYASENVRVVRTIYETLLSKCGFSRQRVFVDWAFGAEIRGNQTADKLAEIYREHCELVVPVVSQHYVQKLWTNHEWRAVQEVLFQRHADDVVIPIYLDGATLNGWPATGSPIHKSV